MNEQLLSEIEQTMSDVREAKGDLGRMLIALNTISINLKYDKKKREELSYDFGFKDGKQAGIEEAMSAFRQLNSCTDEHEWREMGFEFDKDDWCDNFEHILEHYDSGVIVEKVRAYNEEKSKIKVGDEVDWSGDRFIVTRIYKLFVDKNHCDGIGKNGCVYNDVLVESLVKTGRTFPLVASIVEEMTK